jgi:hypothetical protein
MTVGAEQRLAAKAEGTAVKAQRTLGSTITREIVIKELSGRQPAQPRLLIFLLEAVTEAQPKGLPPRVISRQSTPAFECWSARR